MHACSPFKALKVVLIFLLAAGFSERMLAENSEDELFVLTLNELAFDDVDPLAADAAAQNLSEAGASRVRGGLPGFERYPYVFIDDGGSAFLDNPEAATWGYSQENTLGNLRVAIRMSPGAQVRGVLFYPKKREGFLRLPFELPEVLETADRDAFYRVMEAHYERLLAQGVPGSTFFRLQLGEARAGRGEDVPAGSAALRRPGMPGTDLERTFELFSGTRAVAENLALDDELRIEDGGGAAVEPLDSVEGITTPEFDWDRIDIGEPARGDVLAKFIPEDQHGLFFSSIEAWERFRSEYRTFGFPLLVLTGFPGELEGLVERYERQLLLEGETFAALKEREWVDSLALTGGDPYLSSGATVSVLMETQEPERWVEWFRERAVESGGRLERGDYRGYEWWEVRTGDRRIHAVTVALDNAVAVTNSRHQMRRIVGTAEGGVTALSETSDYRYFRGRYGLDPGNETGFLVISDAAIRRWGRPEARIGASRRTRAAAALTELQIANRDLLLAAAEGEPDAERTVHRDDGDDPARLREVVLDPEATILRDAVYNTVDFLTPVDELELRHATAEEIRAYENWRNRYQGRWGDLFCPIALRFHFEDEAVNADLMVFPLIEGSAFREFIEVAGENRIEAGDGDPHPDALLHLVVGIDPDSEPLRESFQAMRGMLGEQLGVNPLDWLGSSAALYLDDGFFLEALQETRDPEAFLSRNTAQLPVGVHIASRSPARLAVFLAAVRGFAEETAPGLLEWTSRRHNGHQYVVVRPREHFFGSDGLSLSYAMPRGALVASLDEEVVRRALDRADERAESPADTPYAWPGKHLNMRIQEGFFPLMRTLFDSGPAANARRSVWRYLPLLNEWKRWYPDRDPVAVHAAIYGAFPGYEQEYEWNDDYKTMVSVRWGHPGEPAAEEGGLPALLSEIREAVFGVTFEMEGLSARAEINRGEALPETAGSGAMEDEATPVDMRNYIGLDDEGARWYYSIEANSTTGTIESEALPLRDTEQGVVRPVRYTITWEGEEESHPAWFSTDWFATTPDLVTHRTDYRLDGEEGMAYTYHYTEPLLRLPAEMVPGKTYTKRYRFVSEGLEEKGDGFGIVHLRLTGFEDVTVPAGSFNNAARVEIIRKDMLPGEDRLSRDRGVTWLGEGVGELRLEWEYGSGERIRQELEAHSRPDVSE